MNSQALEEWRETLGRDRVITEGDRVDLANRATFAAAQRSRAILEPRDRDEVIKCVRIAGRFRVPLYPVSTGRNWGYGSAVPVQDGCVLLLLHRLDGIVDYREDLAYVRIEPGVTFRCLAAFLRDRQSKLLPPATGAGMDTSLIGNVLERGIGKGLYEDMAGHSSDYEVVLPDGEVLQTSFDRHAGASFEGLFCQSNFGVVTRMTLSLEPAPGLRQTALFPIRTPESLALVLDAAREPLQRDSRRLQIELINDYRYLTQTMQYPYDEFDGSTVLPRTWVREKLRPSVNARWIGCATLWADSEEELRLRRGTLAALEPFADYMRFENPAPGHDVSFSTNGLQSAYWRKTRQMPANPNPDRDRCGVIWFVPVLPMLGSTIVQAVARIEEIMFEHGFEPAISLRLIGGRQIHAVVGLLYDRERDGADPQAAQCHLALCETMRQDGFHPYRLTIRDMASRAGTILRGLKSVLDPNGIIAPGRYGP
jgi:4-cresol dehydrogenase (hydroxylating) flavoprotein subunit